MTQQLEYFAFGKNNTQCFEKKKCTLSINTITRIMLIQPVDEDIASIPVAFDRPFLQLKNHLYAFDLVASNDLIIVFQMDIICSQVLAYIQKDKSESNHDLFKTRFLPQFCRRFMPLTLEDSIDTKLIDEIIETFGDIEKEMFSDAVWEQRQKDCQQSKDTQEIVTSKQVSNNAESQENFTTDDFDFTDQIDDENADVTISSQPFDSSQIVSSQMQNNRHTTTYSQSNKVITLRGISTLTTLDPSQYILSQTSRGNPKIIIFISTDKKTCYEYSRSCPNYPHNYYCLGCRAASNRNVSRVFFTQESDGSQKVQMDHSKEHVCQPRIFSESMIVKVLHKDDVSRTIKPRQTTCSVDAEDPDFVIRHSNFKFEKSRLTKVPNGKLIISAPNGVQYNYHYKYRHNIFICTSCNDTVQLSAVWCIDINGEEYLKLGKNKMNHICSGLKRV